MFKEMFTEGVSLEKLVKQDAIFFNGKYKKPWWGINKDEFLELYGIEKADSKTIDEVLKYMVKKHKMKIVYKSNDSLHGSFGDVAFMYNLEKKHPFIQYYIENPIWQSLQEPAPDLSNVGFGKFGR